MTGMKHHRSILHWASEYTVTGERASKALMVIGTVLLVVSYCLPWWSVKYAGILNGNQTVVSYGFSGWGWLSLAAGFAAVYLVTRLVGGGASPHKQLNASTLGWVAFAAGAADLIGNWLFIAAAPQTLNYVGVGQTATRGAGLTIATVAGVALIFSGLLIAVSDGQQSPVRSVARRARTGTVVLTRTTVALFIALFLPWASVPIPFTTRPAVAVSNGFSTWGWMSFVAWLVMVVVVVWRLTVLRGGERLRAKRVVNLLSAWLTLMAGVAELAGNALFLATTTNASIWSGHQPHVDVGFVIAVVAGFVVIASGLLMVASSAWQPPVDSTPSAQSTLVG